MEDQLELSEDRSSVILKQAWDKSLTLLAPEINRPTFESFVKTARPLSLDGNTVTLGASSELAKIFLEKYTDLVRTALESNLGMSVELRVLVAPPDKRKSHSKTSSSVIKAQSVLSPVSQPLNQKYVFSTFVVGPCNRLAHAAALAVARQPGSAYNPLFIYGGPGLGKTHLLQAIAHHVLAEHPGLKVAYVSGETFTYHYVSALREHQSEEFRRKYRSIDIWLVDDVQFLAGKERTKEEFFHTFNALHQASKQVVMSSDRPPKDLSPVEERLKSRFQAGVVVDIAPPDLETRIAILEERATAENAEVPKDVIRRCAELIRSNIRALEGALITLLAYSSLMKCPLTPEVAEEILTRYMINKQRAELSPEAVIRAVARTFCVEPEDLAGKQRTKEIATARHVAMYLCRELTGHPLASIGKAFGGRDHSSVLYACNRIQEEMQSAPELMQTVQRLLEELRTSSC